MWKCPKCGRSDTQLPFTLPCASGKIAVLTFLSMLKKGEGKMKKAFAKRVLGGALTGIMLLSSIPTGTFAEEEMFFETMSEADLESGEDQLLQAGAPEFVLDAVETLTEAADPADDPGQFQELIVDEDPVFEEDEFLFEEETEADLFADEGIEEALFSAGEEDTADEDEAVDAVEDEDEMELSGEEETADEEAAHKASLDTSEMASAQSLTIGSAVTITGKGDQELLYKFVPSEKAVYKVVAGSVVYSAYTEMEYSLYDSAGKEIAYGYDDFSEDDSWSKDCIRILEKDAVYYLGVQIWGSENYSFNLSVDQAENRLYAQLDCEESYFVKSGTQIPLKVSAMGSPSFTYSWQVGGEEVSTEAEYVHTAAQNTCIYCYVYPETGGPESFEIEVKIDNSFSAYAEYANGKGSASVKKYIPAGSSITLTPYVIADSMEGMTYKWSKGIDSTESSVTVSPTGYTAYFCKITDPYGNSKTVKYYVYIDNGLSAYPKGAEKNADGSFESNADMYVDPGVSLTLEVVYSATDTSQLSFTWYKDDDLMENAQGPSVNISYNGGSYDYECVVQDQYDNRAIVYFSIIQKLDVKQAGVIRENAKTLVSGLGTEEDRIFSFTPSVTSAYVIYSVEPLNNWAYLYDETRSDYLTYNDREEMGFCLQYNLVAGKSYYVKVSHWNENDAPATFNISAARLINGVVQTPGQGTPKHIHAFGAWTRTQEPTAVAEGVETRKCACGAAETRTVPKLPAKMTLNASGTLPMKIKQTSKAVVVSDLAAGDYVSSVTSSNTKVVKASVSGNTITLNAQKKTGTATITVSLASGLARSFKVKVTKGQVKTKKIKVASKKVTLTRRSTFDLKPELVPLTTQDGKIKYSVSDKKVCSVSKKGIIKARKKGKATITLSSGKTKVTVTVKVN